MQFRKEPSVTILFTETYNHIEISYKWKRFALLSEQRQCGQVVNTRTVQGDKNESQSSPAGGYSEYYILTTQSSRLCVAIWRLKHIASP